MCGSIAGKNEGVAGAAFAARWSDVAGRLKHQRFMAGRLIN
jgi:hypothetical protein